MEMAHKCTQCGREFQDGSNVILKGCPSCGGKKFLFIRPEDMHKDVLEEKSIKQIAEETKEQFLVIQEEKRKPGTASTSSTGSAGSAGSAGKTGNTARDVEMYERIESITVINPGSYELNLEKLAESDELVIRMGSDDRYMVDIHSMGKSSKPKPKPKPKKKTEKRR
jgi:predicted  nucleic acid-binding Zn-ribbon protein